MRSLTTAFAASSPRVTPRATPWASLLIHGAVVGVWLALLLRGLVLTGAGAWSVGIAYIGYDTFLLGFVAWRSRALWAGPPRPLPGAARPSLTVVIAARDEAAALPGTLADLLAQSDPADRILIADDGSTDATAALLARDYGLAMPPQGEASAPSDRYPGLRWLRLPHGGKARALNAALLQIDTDLLVTLDADTKLDHGALAAMRAAFAAEAELVAATGVLTPVCAPGPGAGVLQWFQTYEYIRNFLSRHAWMQADGLLLISGAFAGFRLAPLLEVGGFDPECFVEDYELIHRLRRHAADRGVVWRTRVLATARARTDAPATIPAFLLQRRRWFGGFLQTQYWYREMVGNARHGRLGTWMLPVKAVDTLQPIYGLTALVLLLVALAQGRLSVLLPVSLIIGAKLAIDLTYHLWSVALYRRWVGERGTASLGQALVAALAEPFSFQILRHLGAAWGWVTFLGGNRLRVWG
jgi:cellulose synthase/poly-beta-1,6-N-acetylglucosamine synthase-like glycosyltransferase